MALRILMLKRSIDKKKEELELLRSKDSELKPVRQSWKPLSTKLKPLNRSRP